MQFLESQLIQRAKDAKRMRLDNIKSENEPTLSEADRADMLVFLDNMLSMLPVLGISAFEVARNSEANASTNSQASVEMTPSMHEQMRGIVDLRQDLISNGVLEQTGDHFVFEQNYSFSSPSTAAANVLGRSANGRVEWKDTTGRTLKQIQETLNAV